MNELLDNEVRFEQGVKEATERLRRSGTWKRQRVIVVMPTAQTIPTRVALALWDLTFPPNNDVAKIIALSSEVGHAYSEVVKCALQHPKLSQWEYILFVEHDNLPPRDGLLKLIADMEEHPELSAIGGLYFTKGPEGYAQIWGVPGESHWRPQLPSDGIVECRGIGMGFSLFRISMFADKRLRYPWFATLPEEGTHDLYFWSDASRHGYRCAVDCRVRVGHLDEDGKVW